MFDLLTKNIVLPFVEVNFKWIATDRLCFGRGFIPSTFVTFFPFLRHFEEAHFKLLSQWYYVSKWELFTALRERLLGLLDSRGTGRHLEFDTNADRFFSFLAAQKLTSWHKSAKYCGFLFILFYFYFFIFSPSFSRLLSPKIGTSLYQNFQRFCHDRLDLLSANVTFYFVLDLSGKKLPDKKYASSIFFFSNLFIKHISWHFLQEPVAHLGRSSYLATWQKNYHEGKT